MICNLCPRRCHAERGDAPGSGHGLCGMPAVPVIARAGLHFWEAPVISGTRGSGAVFFSGCNLRCVFCQNYDISTGGAGTAVSIERLREIYRELVAAGAHNLNLVTPAHYTEAILESLAEPPPVPVVWNTNAYESVETLRRVRGKVQIFLPDLKYADPALAARYSGAPDYVETAQRTIDEMFEQTGPFELGPDGLMKKGVIIRHLILPGQVKNSLAVIDYVKRRFRPGDVMFSLLHQFIPCGRVSEHDFPELNRRLRPLEYKRVERALFDSGIEDGFVQESGAADAAFIPAFDGTGVRGAS